VLREDFLAPLGLSEYRLANDIGVPPRRINEIVKGKRGITADTALRLSRYFAWPAKVWLNLQCHYDRQVTEAEMRPVRWPRDCRRESSHTSRSSFHSVAPSRHTYSVAADTSPSFSHCRTSANA
jgi:addiction module HigA family antidote